MKNMLFLLPLAAAAAHAQHEQPNILVILADDMARSELGCYGGKNLDTPNIDKIAHEGMMMTNNFASMSMSVPIRASMYTGLYPCHHGSYQNHKATYPNVRSVTHYMSQLGYRVGRAGKDHPSGQQRVYDFEAIDGFTVNCVASQPPLSTSDGILEFMNRSNDQPFCLFVCSINSHMPWDAGDASEFDADKVVLPPNCVDNARTRSDFTRYLAEIRLFDNEVGMVMKALKDAGANDNTIVILLSEQGPQMPFGKWTCYRYGQASAMIVRYPGKVEAGSVSDALVQYEDILPTMIDAAGGQTEPSLDGISQLDVFLGKDTGRRQWVYGMHNNIPEGTAYPIRSIQDKRYKLIENLSPDSKYYEKHMMGVGDNMWNSWVATAQTDNNARWIVDRFVSRPAIEFYDLQEDPWELHNLADDPQYAERISYMDLELKRWMEEQGDRGVALDTDNPEDPALKTPQAVTSYEDLEKIRADLTGNFYLANDIVVPQGVEWVPLDAKDKHDTNPARFRGIIDGRGHSIKGITVRTPKAFKGLFGRIDHATVKNLKLENVDIIGTAPTGAVAGAMIGGSTIEKVSVTGAISSDSEAGGIVGRVARDATHTGYNVIRDSYVDADITATRLSSTLDAPSCAGGFVGYIHSNSGSSVARLHISRTYYTGSVHSDQMGNISGIAAGAIGFTDNNRNIRLQDVIILADDITAATPNYYYSRRLPVTPNNIIEYMDNLYVKDDISLAYYADKGVGGQIPEGTIQCLPDAVFRTKEFYTKTLSWDFDNTWTIIEGAYPTLMEDTADKLVEVRPPASGLYRKGYYDFSGRLIDAANAQGLYIYDGKKRISPQ